MMRPLLVELHACQWHCSATEAVMVHRRDATALCLPARLASMLSCRSQRCARILHRSPAAAHLEAVHVYHWLACLGLHSTMRFVRFHVTLLL
jgi:hypothetical protein